MKTDLSTRFARVIESVLGKSDKPNRCGGEADEEACPRDHGKFAPTQSEGVKPEDAPKSEKYPRTPHVPWSGGVAADDKMLKGVDHFLGVPIRITEKLDGENRTWTRDQVFARSHGAGAAHPSSNWAKAKWAEKKHLIDPGLSVFMEDTFATHSIYYRDMAKEKNYLFVIGVRDDKTGEWWSTEDVDLMAATLDLPTPPVLFEGTVNSEEELKRLMPGDGKSPSAFGGVPIQAVKGKIKAVPGADPDGSIREGEVLRTTAAFNESDFAKNLAKAVRPGHVQSQEHWKTYWRPQHDVKLEAGK